MQITFWVILQADKKQTDNHDSFHNLPYRDKKVVTRKKDKAETNFATT